jgi:GntR family transcriptional repressor for pyruvate dehydrogenase complex
LREALSSLSALGVISIQPGKGVFVQSPVDWRGEARRAGRLRRRLRRWISFNCAMRWRVRGGAGGGDLEHDELDALEDNVAAMRNN